MLKKLASLFICLLFLLPLLSPLAVKAAEEADPFEAVSYELRTRNATPIVDTATVLYLDFSTEAIADIPTVRYEWYKDGELLPTVTGTKLSLTKAQLSDEGEYTVRITLTDGVDTRVIECGPLFLRVFTLADLLGWVLVGLSIFAIPPLALAAVSLVRYVKKKKTNQ